MKKPWYGMLVLLTVKLVQYEKNLPMKKRKKKM